MVGLGSKSRLLRHVTALLLCLYVKHTLLSFFNAVGSSNSMSRFFSILRLVERTLAKEMGNFSDGKTDGHSFRIKTAKLPSKRFGI